MGEVVVVINGGATVVDEADAPRVLDLLGARAATDEETVAFLAGRGVLHASVDQETTVTRESTAKPAEEPAS
jgi:hypothetical protein